MTTATHWPTTWKQCVHTDCDEHQPTLTLGLCDYHAEGINDMHRLQGGWKRRDRSLEKDFQIWETPRKAKQYLTPVSITQAEYKQGLEAIGKMTDIQLQRASKPTDYKFPNSVTYRSDKLPRRMCTIVRAILVNNYTIEEN